jgi:hypothetical protein
MGLGSTPQPMACVPGLRLAPAPHYPTVRRNVARNFTPPTQRADPADVQRAGAVIMGMAIALSQLDYFTRQMQGLGKMKHQTKAKLNQLAALSDAVLELVQQQFDSQDADAVNLLGDVLGQSAELLLQLQPTQIEAALHHQHNMATSNLAYVPATK